MKKFLETIKLWEHYHGVLSSVQIFSDGTGAFINEDGDEVFQFKSIKEFYEADPANINNNSVKIIRDSGEAIPGVCDEIEELWS